MATIGEQVEARYKQLGLTQDSLAWLAGVSVSTVRNVLRGRVSEARTWPHVERALGWMPGSLERLRRRELPDELLPVDVMRPILEALLRLENRRAYDPDAEVIIRNFLRHYRVALNGLAAQEEGRPTREEIESLAAHLYTRVSSEEMIPVIDFFEQLGWMRQAAWMRKDFPWEGVAARERIGGIETRRLPTDSDGLAGELHELGREVAELRQTIKLYEEPARAFARLPARVQELLMTGDVVDADVVQPPKISTISMATMVVRTKDPQRPMTAEERRGLINSLHIWHMTLAISGHMFDVFQRQGGWFAPDEVEEKIHEALRVVADSELEGLGQQSSDEER